MKREYIGGKDAIERFENANIASDFIDVDEHAEQAQRDAASRRQRVERKPLNEEPGLGDYIAG